MEEAVSRYPSPVGDLTVYATSQAVRAIAIAIDFGARGDGLLERSRRERRPRLLAVPCRTVCSR
jgi:hypothetical protein